ncbi:MAG: sulfite exporter TauE/SafE family protein [Alphaproteobacteria bacterium]|nr:sulfite exporter TauE/SafE family protein [Alphaproteobacteria bacterium]
MLEGHQLGDLLILGAGLLASGVAAGLIAGLLGVGGGIVVVPVLYYVLTALDVSEEVRMHLAVGTSLAVIIPTSIRSLTSHAKRGAVDFDILKRWAPAMIGGVAVGSVFASSADGDTLTAIFASVALLVAANLAFGKESWRLGAALPGVWIESVMAGIIGALSTMMGIGGGTFGVTAMTLYGVPIHRAVATSSGLGLLISVPGTLGLVLGGLGVADRPPFSLGYANLLGFALIVPASVLAAPLGVHLAHGLSRKMLTRVFAFFLAVTSAKMFYGLWAG